MNAAREPAAAAKRKEMTMRRLFVLVAIAVTTSAPAYAQGFTFGTLSNFIQVKLGGLCLIAPSSGTGYVVQGSCASDPTRWWKVVPAASDPAFFTIENNHRCLDVPGGTNAVGQDLQVYPCHWQTNQQFRLINRAGEWQIQPKAGIQDNLCLDIEGGTPMPGARLQQYACKTIDVANQRFLLRPQTQEPQFVDCDSDEWLHVRWPGAILPGEITLFAGNAGYFPASVFWYWCTTDSSDFAGAPSGDADGLFVCPPATRTIEVNRSYTDRFRAKCAI
jgi:hypothetical protein